MSAEHTLFSNDPNSEVQFLGINTLNGEPMDVYAEPTELPSDPQKRALCEEHINTGIKAELLNDFWMAGCHFDTALKEGVIRIQYDCPGRSGILKRCRLALVQYDKEGNELTRGTVSKKID